jgi:putative ABC transport system ATP-binding protein
MLVGLEQISRIFFDRNGNEVIALQNIDLEIAEGELLVISGRSGSGKSTLLSIIGMLDRPSTGRHILLGEDVNTLPNKAYIELRKNNIGYMFQSASLIDRMSVLDNVLLTCLYRGGSKSENNDAAIEALQSVDMAHRLEHFPSELSGGERLRVELARALVAKPKLLLCDEPTANLDEALSKEVVSLLQNISAQGASVVIASHDPAVLDAFPAGLRL